MAPRHRQLTHLECVHSFRFGIPGLRDIARRRMLHTPFTRHTTLIFFVYSFRCRRHHPSVYLWMHGSLYLYEQNRT